ncbi:MAG: hypothetical protein QXR45_10120 [Candidatus Bathyarchaeia archaeon]
MKIKLYEDVDGTIYEVEVPLCSKVDVKQISTELGLPSYVEVGNLTVDRTIVTIWASHNATQPKIPEKLTMLKKPINLLLFGGMAIKIHCPSANKPNGSLNRDIKDVDFVIPKHDGPVLIKLMLEMSHLFGSRYLYFVTRGEKWFNLLRGGKRYRVRGISAVTYTNPQVNIIDIFCDELPFRHTIKIKDCFKKAKENLYTIGLENLLLSKCQFISSMPRSQEIELKKVGQDFRILPYEYLKDKIAVGMELKDMKDVAAILLDHEIGEGPEQININNLKKILGGDKKFTLTFQLNLQNLINKIDVLKNEGLTSYEANKIVEMATEILNKLPKIKKWEKPWWNIDIETPQIRV